MKRLANWMLRIYPPRWRARYGDEMRALLAESGADARVVNDLFVGGVRMQLKEWSFAKLATVLGTVGMLAGLALTWFPKPVYRSTATMRITMPFRLPLWENFARIQTSVLSRATLSRIATDPKLQLYSEELRTRQISDVVEEMCAHIRFGFDPGPSGGLISGGMGNGIRGGFGARVVLHRAAALDISFVYADRFKAQQTLRALMAAMLAANLESSPPAVLDVMEAASLPVTPYRPGVYSTPVSGLVAGLICAGVIAMVHGGRNRPAISLFNADRIGVA